MSGTTSLDAATLAYGLTAGGFVRMRLPEIRRLIFDELNAATGLTWHEDPDAFMGQTVNVFAERYAAAWELLELVYLSAYPVTATGQSLDLAVSYAGVIRSQARSSQVQVVLFGDQGTIVPQGSQIESTFLPAGSTQYPRFRLAAGVAISRDDLAVLNISIGAPTNGRVFAVTLETTTFQQTAGPGDTSATIAARMAATMVAAGWTVTANGVGGLQISRADPFAATWLDTVNLIGMGTPGLAEAVDAGPIPAPIGSLTQIVDPQTGWSAVTNYTAAALGTTRESDGGLRTRYARGVYRLGAGTVPAIEANLRNDVLGVSYCKVSENYEDTADPVTGLPPHSIEAVIEGGDDSAIATKLFQIKGAGITPVGTTTVPVRDVDGWLQPMRFSRPAPIYIFLRVTYTKASEEVAPGDAADQIARAMAAAGNTLQPGQNVIPQRLIAAAFDAVPGLATISVTLASSTNPLANPASLLFSATNEFPISVRNRAVFDATRITATPG